MFVGTVATNPEWSASSPVAHRTVRRYDANLNLESVTDGSGNTATYTYDAADQLVSQTRPDTTTIRNEYRPNGRLQAQVDGAGHATRYGYDALGRLATMTDPLNRVTRYGYDKSGNLATQEDPGGNCATSPKTGCVTYGYDAVNRLTSVTYSDGVTPNVSNVQYDAVGRRVAMTDGTGTSTWGWDSLGRMTRAVDGSGTVVGYGYNLRGQATTITYPGSVGAVLRRFDAVGRLDRATDLAGDGLRTSKAVGGAARSFTWDVSGGLPLLIKDGTTSIIYGPNGLPLEQVAADGTAQWFFHDQLGSTRALTDAAGTVVRTWTYDPYGSVQASTGTATTNLRFAGEYSDDETGFVFLRARYYDPATGQFLTRDPLAHITRQPYAYAGNNSLNRIDPFGMAPQTPSFTGRRGGFAAHVATEPQSPGMSCDDYLAYLRVAAAYAQTTADGRYYAMLAAQEARAQRRAATLAEASELKRQAEADRREAERPLFEAMIDDPQFQYVDDVLKVGGTVFACVQGGFVAVEVAPHPYAAVAGCIAGGAASLTDAPPGYGI